MALVVLAGLRAKGVECVDRTSEVRMFEIDTRIEDRYADAAAVRIAGRTADSSDTGRNDLRRSASASRLAFAVLVCGDRPIRNDGKHGRIVQQGGQGIRIRHSDCRGIDAAESLAERGAGLAHHRSSGRGTGAV